jgi:hypothetical protein
MVIDPIYKLEDIVYLKTDREQKPWMVTGYYVNRYGKVLYQLVCEDFTYTAYDIELSLEKQYVV